MLLLSRIHKAGHTLKFANRNRVRYSLVCIIIGLSRRDGVAGGRGRRRDDITVHDAPNDLPMEKHVTWNSNKLNMSARSLLRNFPLFNFFLYIYICME